MARITPPDLPPLLINGTGNNKYVCTYKNQWDKEKGHSYRVPGSTKSVGKFIVLDSETGYGEIIFSKEFKQQYPELEHFRVFKNKKKRELEFKIIDPEENFLANASKVVRLHGGATWALNQIVGGSPLVKALREVFSDYHKDRRLLALAYYLVINGDSALANYEEFAEATFLPYIRGRSSGAISRLLRSIKKDHLSKFLNALQKETQKAYGTMLTERRYWALDSTSITSYSENISSVEWGHNKDLIEAPQTNVLLVVDQTTGEPVYFRNFDGNTPDVSTVRNTLAELAIMQIDYSNVVLVTDRGYSSSQNWEDMMRNGMSFVSNARRNLNSAITELINEHYAQLLDWNNYLDFIEQSAVTVPIAWRYDEFPVEGLRRQKQTKKTLYVHLYYNHSINEEDGRRLRTALFKAIGQYKADPAKLTDAQRVLFKNYADEATDGTPTINMQKADQKLRYSGVRVLVSDVITDAQECHIAYENRVQVEHAFRTLKTRLACDRTNVHSTEAWEGKLFLQMLATSISQMVRMRIKSYNEEVQKSGRKLGYRLHYDSDRKLLAKLNNIYLLKCPSGWVFDEISGHKKDLFRIIGVPVPTVGKTMVEDKEDDQEIDISDDTSMDIALDDLENL